MVTNPEYLQVQLEHLEHRVTQLYNQNAELRQRMIELSRLFILATTKVGVDDN